MAMLAGAGAQQVPVHERFQRDVHTQAADGQTCVVLDAQIFPNAAPSLKDLRLVQDGREVPYAVTLSASEQTETAPARVENLRRSGHDLVFDLVMPPRPYTDVVLDLAAHDFVATAVVTGREAASQAATYLGTFNVFDLTAQRLGRATTLHLPEFSFARLHLVLSVSPVPGAPGGELLPQMLLGATVPPSRDAQALYTNVATAAALVQRGKATVASFVLPPRVPVERVSFDLDSRFTQNFSRGVTVTARPQDAPVSASESATGTIQRVRLTLAGRELRQQQLSLPVAIGSNLQGPAQLEVTINNGDQAPLPITAVRLEMRQRRLCFDSGLADGPTLFYGDPALAAPVYDYARMFASATATHTAWLGPQVSNASFRPRQDTRPLMERHPHAVWFGLLAFVLLLALVSLRSSRRLSV
ncbi:MAG: hypothetical protein KGK08_13220 [Acidobacteriota bacterium]|nr:hypothetical protein [Acidobacteriota bacterium]